MYSPLYLVSDCVLLSKFKPGRGISPARNPIRPSRPTNATLSTPPGDTSPFSHVPQAEPPEEVPNAFQTAGFYAVLFFIFLRFSFLHEFVGSRLNVNLHPIVIVGGLSYLCCLLSGRLFRAFQERSTWLWCGFAICVALATITSFWKGGSLPVFEDFIETACPVIIVIPALVVTRPQLKTLLSTIGFACITMVVLGTVNDDFRSGRMGVDIATSEIQNPNDYAAQLILMLPALAFWAFRSGRSILFKIIGTVVMVLGLRLVLSSGSRGALLSLAITTIFILITGSKRLKLGILVGVPALALAAIPFVPAESLLRLSTLFSSSAAIKNGEAAESSEARLILLQESWKATLQRPFTGVGPGMFMDYQAKTAGENGERGMWHVTHNSYTQVSSECGLPALFLFVGALVLTFNNLRKVVKSGDTELVPIAGTVSVMLVAYCVCIFFLSLAYSVHLLTLSAVAVSMKLRLLSDGRLQAEENERNSRSPEAVLA